MDSNGWATRYRDKSPELVEGLRQFRMDHPPKTVDIGATEWKYVACGHGDELVIVLPGALSTAGSSQRVIQLLEGGFRVLAPSYPELGDLDEVLEGIVALMGKEAVSRGHIIGHSLGAGIAHALVRSHPGKVLKLCLSGFGLYNEAHFRQIRLSYRLLRFLPYSIISLIYQRRLANLLWTVGKEERAFLKAYTGELFEIQLNKEKVLAQLGLLIDMFERPDHFALFKPISKQDVLILQAKDDSGFRSGELRAIREAYPNASSQELEYGGHMLSVTRRGAYEQAILNFLTS